MWAEQLSEHLLQPHQEDMQPCHLKIALQMCPTVTHFLEGLVPTQDHFMEHNFDISSN